jgi:hypothetical protein
LALPVAVSPQEPTMGSRIILFSKWVLPALLMGCACLNLQAQEFTALLGATRPDDSSHSSYSYQAEYRQVFFRNLSASASYINEGHFPGHHRDGEAIEVWGRLPSPHSHVSFDLGVGAYYYYDTQVAAGGGSLDVHGTAPIYSASVTGYFSERAFYRATINHIGPNGEPKTNTAVLGVGVWFGRDHRPTPGDLGDSPSDRDFMPEHEVTVYAGQSVVNTFLSPTGRAYAMEYRHSFYRHIDWTVSMIYEGNPEIVRRSGLAAQGWAVNEFFNDRFTAGIGFGPYFYIDSKHPSDQGTTNPPKVAGLGSLSLSERLSHHWMVRLVCNRVGSNYNRDADIILLGLGYRWAS